MFMCRNSMVIISPDAALCAGAAQHCTAFLDIVNETLNKTQFVWKYSFHNKHLGNSFMVTSYGLLKDYCSYLMKYYAQYVKSLAGLPLRWITWLILKLNFFCQGTTDHLVKNS